MPLPKAAFAARALPTWGAEIQDHEARILLERIASYLNQASGNQIDSLRLYLYNKFGHKDHLLGDQIINDIRDTLDGVAAKRHHNSNKK